MTRARFATDLIEIANAIPKAYQDQVEHELGSNRMLWNFSEEIARSASQFETAYPGFGHMAYLADESEPMISPLSSLLLPILFVFCEKANIEYNALLRVRVGLFTKTITEAKHHNPARRLRRAPPDGGLLRERLRRRHVHLRSDVR